MRSLDAAKHAAGAPCQAIDLIMRVRGEECVRARASAGTSRHGRTSDGILSFQQRRGCRSLRATEVFRDQEGAIIDWDVHHGNGTQGIFYDDPTVYFFSSHQYPWYPGTGTRGEKGTGRGLGYTLNLPLRAATPAADQKRGFEAALDEMSNTLRPI